MSYKFFAVLLLATVVSTKAHALENTLDNAAFTGFQIDTRGQYLAYGALRRYLKEPDGPVVPFVQLFALQQRFYTRSDNQLLPGQLTSIAATVGLRKKIDSLDLQVSAGPSFLINHSQSLLDIQNETSIHQKETTYRVGYTGSGYAQYWKGSHGLEGLLSYTNLESIIYGRARWFYAEYETEGGTPITPGLEVLGVGNSEFHQVYAGALLQTEIKKVELLLKGGYQNNSTFHGGGYGGVELYVRF